MGGLVLAGNTSGSTTLQATDAVTATITLPSTSGTVVVNNGAQTIEFADGSASAPSITNSGDTNTGIFFPAADTIAFTEGGTEAMRIDSSGNLGIGIASPTGKIHAYTASASNVLGRFQNTVSTVSYGVDSAGTGYFGNSGAYPILFQTNDTERMRLDSSGNLGLGVTPSAWGSTYKAVQVGIGSSFTGMTNDVNLNLANNARFDGTNWIYLANSPAERYRIWNGQHQWYTSASGTAGNTISFSQAMTLDASSNLSVTGTINGATLFGQGISIGNGGNQTITCPRSFDTRGAQIFIGGVVQGVGGRAGLYITTGYGNGVTTISAFAGLTVTCNTSAGTITIANASGATVDGRVTVTY